MRPCLRPPALLRALLTALLSVPVLAWADGAISGVVKKAGTGDLLPGASIRLSPGGREVVSDRAGEYVITGVPAGSYTVEVSYLGLEPKTSSITVTDGQTARADQALTEAGTIVLQAFTVESIREGQSRAINQQRTSNTIKNIISADAIGNLPDRTVGEALGRLPGVNVVDDSKASIRGTAAQYNAVTLDGERFTTSGDSVESTQTQTDSRAVDLSLIPSELVGGIEVIKALTPDMDADSFGGTINLVTRSAFDLKERSINGKFEYIHNDYRNGNGGAGSITYMDVLNKERTLGVSATLTYRKEKRYTDSYEISYYDAGTIPLGTAGTPSAIAAVGDQGIEEFDQRLNFRDVKKIGGILNFDWKVSPNTELHWRTFYENNHNDGGRFRNRARALNRWDATSTAALESGQQIRFVNLHEDGTRRQDVFRVGLDGKTRLDAGTLSYGYKYGDGTSHANLDRYIFEFPSNTERRAYSWKLDRSDPKLPVFSMTKISNGQNGLYTDLADRRLTSLRFVRGHDRETDNAANLDYALPQKLGDQPVEFKVGAKYRGKERKSRPGIRDYNPIAPTLFSQFTVVSEPRDVLEGRIASMGPYVSLPEVVARYTSNPSAWNGATGDETNALEARKYNVSEDISAGYAMASTQFNRLEVMAGVRWEKTKTAYTWLANPLGVSNGSKTYDDFYPGLFFTYRFNQDLVARLAYTNTLARPNYGDLIPYRVLADTHAESGNGGLEPGDYPETNKVYLGNADLKAQQSENFDLSLEYYIKPTGVLSVALFRKNLTDLIFRSQFKDPAAPTTIYFQDRNGSKGKVEGVEFSWQQSLTFLPGVLNGLGVNLNATFTKGSSELEELVPGSTTTYRPFHVDFLPEQPKKVYNAQVWWEKYGFTARVALNYVDTFVRTSGGRTAFSVNDKATRVDASVAYRLNRNLTLYVEGKNLTKEVSSFYASVPTRPEDYTFTGATFNGGVKFRF